MKRTGETPLTEAQQTLVMENLGLAYEAAQRFGNILGSMDPKDRIGEACLEMVRAASYHTGTKGRYSTLVYNHVMRRFLQVKQFNGRAKRTAKVETIHREDRAKRGGGHNCTPIPDDGPGPLDVAAQHEAADRLRWAVTCLTPSQREIIELHYGLDPRGPLTAREIAALRGCTEENIRLMRSRALKHLRHLMEGYEAA